MLPSLDARVSKEHGFVVGKLQDAPGALVSLIKLLCHALRQKATLVVVHDTTIIISQLVRAFLVEIHELLILTDLRKESLITVFHVLWVIVRIKKGGGGGLYQDKEEGVER